MQERKPASQRPSVKKKARRNKTFRSKLFLSVSAISKSRHKRRVRFCVYSLPLTHTLTNVRAGGTSKKKKSHDDDDDDDDFIVPDDESEHSEGESTRSLKSSSRQICPLSVDREGTLLHW